jgi:hypothetical protein|tara:strand:+ start:205 stop:1386 length:1182 start_codon:yes stop_codon:yes gene_type:complete
MAKSCITKHTEKYDEVVSLTNLYYDENNLELYGEDDVKYTEALDAQIKEFGLINPPIVYDTNEIKSGHTRVRRLIELGYKEIPIIRSSSKKPKDVFDNMMALMIENQGRPANLTRQYNQVETATQAYQKKYGKITSTYVLKTKICPAAQISYDMYKLLKDLETDRVDLFKRVMANNGETLSPTVAKRLMLNDKRQAAIMPMSKIMDGLVQREDVVYATNAVSNALNQFLSIQVTNRDGKFYDVFENIQQNTLGAIVHETITNTITESINFRKQIGDHAVAFAPKNQRIDDVSFPRLNGGFEVKTCHMKGGNKLQFTSSKPKSGYYLFAGFNSDYSYVFCAYGFMKFDVWKRAGRTCTLDMQKFYDEKLTYVLGDLKYDKRDNKVICMPEALTV